MGPEFNGRIPQDLPQLTQQTLIIWGEFDNIIPIEQGRQLNEDIPNATFEVVSGAGHSPYFDEPAETAELILGFLEE